MTRLIDADYLIDDIEHCLWDWESVDGITASTVLKQTITDIKNQPTIDAVQVIRCKDCKQCRKTILFGHFATVCDYWIKLTDDDGYCNHAERKEDG